MDPIENESLTKQSKIKIRTNNQNGKETFLDTNIAGFSGLVNLKSLQKRPFSIFLKLSFIVILEFFSNSKIRRFLNAEQMTKQLILIPREIFKL
jgi:hypothetical protein